METKELADKLETEAAWMEGEDRKYGARLMQQAATRLRELEAAQRWRPIGEAEKGAVIGLHMSEHGWYSVFDCCWNETFGCFTDFEGAFFDRYPTHFKPIDLPPAPGQGGEG